MSALVLALSGTDHHPFDRLVRWVDAAAAYHDRVRFIVQHGTAMPPRIAEGHQVLPHDRMIELMAAADLVVCHGGPGTIMDAREAGHVPLCVPRDPRFGEHVDDHQQRFAASIGAEGIVRPIGSLEDFHREVTDVLETGSRPPASAALTGARDAARTLVASELDALFLVRPRRLTRRVSLPSPRRG